MADEKKTPDLLDQILTWLTDHWNWVLERIGDPALSRQMMLDLGLNPDTDAVPGPIAQAAGTDTLDQLTDLYRTIEVFADAVRSEDDSARDVAWLLFRVWVADSLRARSPAAYAVCKLGGLVAEDPEMLDQLDLAPLAGWLRGDEGMAEAVVDRLSFLGGTGVVLVDALWADAGAVIDATYGWDPEPGDDPEAAAIAARALTVSFDLGDLLRPEITVIGVPTEHGGAGVVLSAGAAFEIGHRSGDVVYTTTAAADGAFAAYLGAGEPRVLSGLRPSLAVRSERAPDLPPGPALTVGGSGAVRLEIGALNWGIEVGADHAGFRMTAAACRLRIRLDDADAFLGSLGSGVDMPFEIGLVADTAGGVRFQGGTGLAVELPVAASLFGVLTVHYLRLGIDLDDGAVLELRGGFSVHLGPFEATVDAIGMGADLGGMVGGDFAGMARFLPPKGIGLRLDAGVVTGGGYLFVDPARGEYAGALELTIAGAVGVKAICVITTKRPDGGDGWSMLLLIYARFRVHIAYGIFLTAVGGLIGLHHRADVDALTAGLRTGALDDVLFPENPVADAPRILARYRQMFPIEPESLLLGPMLELSFSQPAIVHARLGLVFEVANALGGDRPVTLTRVILLGQLLVQLPPRELKVPAILKLVVDVLGTYDAQERSLLLRARLRDSFVGIEGVTKLVLSGELLVLMRFGDDPAFVLSAGGFHPAFRDLPAGVPSTLERMAVSFGIDRIKMTCESYFAVTSNTVQAGFRVSLKAKISKASIDGRLSFDTLLFLTPRFRFLVDLAFSVSVKAFGRTLCSVGVSMRLEGPGEWRAVGSFSFSIAWWDYEIDFDEGWGSAPEVETGTTSAVAAIMAELSDPARLLPEAPPGGGPVTLAESGARPAVPLAHPLGRLAVRQRAVPFGVAIDRIGTARLTEGEVVFGIDSVSVGGTRTDATEPVVDHFARGQYMELGEQEKLAGSSFERFSCGVAVGTDRYVAPAGRVVSATYEEKVLEPEPAIARTRWRAGTLGEGFRVLPGALLGAHVRLGAAARSGPGRLRERATAGPGAATVRTGTPLAVVDPATLAPVAGVLTATVTSPAVAERAAAAVAAVVVEAFELPEDRG